VMHSRLFTGRPTPDNAQLCVAFRNGVMASIFASFCIDDGQFYSNSMVLNYERGTIYRNAGSRPFAEHHRHPVMSVVAKSGTEKTVIEEAHPQESSGRYQWEIFHRAVRGETIPDAVTPAQIVAGIRIINAMARAERSGASEQV